MLSACSTQSIKKASNTNLSIVPQQVSDSVIIIEESLAAPDLNRIKNGKTLKLTKIMEGGACKDKLQGALGLFRLYTNSDDVERIKQNQGVAIFADLETSIQSFSMQALQQAVNELDFQSYLFEIDESKIKTNLSAKLHDLFINLIAKDIAEFEAKTSLMIDISPLPNSLTIYLNDCEIEHEH
jgi:hypothetical protein